MEKLNNTAPESSNTASESTNTTAESENTATESTNTAPESENTRKKRLPLAEQDQRVANEISEASVLIEMLDRDPALAARIGKTGVSKKQLTEAKALQATAQADFTARQSKMGLADSEITAAKNLHATNEKDYADFRVILRQSGLTAAQRTALGLDGKIPQDRQKLLTQLRASYTEARKPIYRATLDAEGYTIAALDALLASASLLDTRTASARQAIGDAQAATEARNRSTAALRRWSVGVKTRARRSLVDHPELLRQLGA